MTARTAAAYYRVSSDPQAQSGWSLERQQQVVREYANQQRLALAAEHTEGESAYRRGTFYLERRPGLQAALSDCQRLKATLLIATLDRLARNVVLIATLMESRVEFIALDLPDATPFMLHIFAAIAEEESRQRGRVISAAKALSKARGKVFVPNVKPLIDRANARAEAYRPVIDEIRSRGMHGSREIAKELARRKIVPPTSRPWSSKTVLRLLKRLCLYEEIAKPRNQIWVEERRAARGPLCAIIRDLRASGLRGRKVAVRLNGMGLRTGTGRPWTPQLIAAYLAYRPRIANGQGQTERVRSASLLGRSRSR